MQLSPTRPSQPQVRPSAHPERIQRLNTWPFLVVSQRNTDCGLMVNARRIIATTAQHFLDGDGPLGSSFDFPYCQVKQASF